MQKRLNDYNILPRKNLEKKLEYFMLPYNRTLNYNKYMDFREGQSNISKWKKLSDFVLKENKVVLRRSLVQINNALYVEFENVAKWAMNRIKNRGFLKGTFGGFTYWV